MRFSRSKLFGVYRQLFRAIGTSLASLGIINERQVYTYMYMWYAKRCPTVSVYYLVAGVSFDLFDSLYKPDAPKTTTVHVH